MTRPDFGKWIDRVGPDDAVSDVVHVALQSRLAAVQYYLPLAADEAEADIEHVHQLRVATRRAVAALKLFRHLLPRRRRRRLASRLGEIRRAAGPARDLDVLLLRETGHRETGQAAGEGGSPLALRLQRERREAQAPIVDVRRRLTRRQRLARQIDGLLGRVSKHPRDLPGRSSVPFDRWARHRLRPIVKKFFRAAPAEMTDIHALHQFRIRGKQLRYAMELLVAAFPPLLRDELYPEVEQLQEQLGQINDHATTLRRVRQWLESPADPGEAAELRQMQDRESRQLELAVSQFVGWWTPRYAAELQRRFRELLSGAPGR
ncbi:MAG: CHAD domain-containing protein [Pirellulaceae bacterium]|nr:CHAD domain-containing protein [Pirellulaceae bacterium]